MRGADMNAHELFQISTTELLCQAWRDTYRPHRLFQDPSGLVLETISYPYAEQTSIFVKARVPGDPMTIQTMLIADLEPLERDCDCHPPTLCL